MRIKRVEKFKKIRHDRVKNLIVLTVVLPTASIFLGYLITSLVILPSMTR